MVSAHINRESWLQSAAGKLAPMIEAHGHPLPRKLRLSVGWPFGGRETIGQCWRAEASGDGTVEIFVSPELDNGPRVLDVILHELIHAAVGCDEGHGGEFKRVARALGLEGKLTSTTAGPDLLEKLRSIAQELGAYPHAELSRAARAGKKQAARMHKIVCGACGYVVRAAQKWIERGLPICCCGGVMELEEKGEEGEGE